MAKGSQRGPTAAHHTHKQKKAQLQAARRKTRERANEALLDAYEAAIADATSRVPKVVQARAYPYREGRGGEVHVRLKLSIDRQLCVGFTPGRAATAAPSSLPLSSAPPPPPSASERRARALRARAQMIRTALSETTKLKHITEIERRWTDNVHSCVKLVDDVSSDLRRDGEGRGTSAQWAFGLIQQALQTGPLTFGKPAQFKRLAKALAARGRATDGGPHPHARTVRQLLVSAAGLVRAVESAAETMPAVPVVPVVPAALVMPSAPEVPTTTVVPAVHAAHIAREVHETPVTSAVPAPPTAPTATPALASLEAPDISASEHSAEEDTDSGDSNGNGGGGGSDAGNDHGSPARRAEFSAQTFEVGTTGADAIIAEAIDTNAAVGRLQAALSVRQCDVIRGWLLDFERAFATKLSARLVPEPIVGVATRTIEREQILAALAHRGL